MSERVSFLDMTVAQVEAVELAVGLPVTRWREAPSQVQLLRLVLGQVRPELTDEAIAAMTLRELLATVDLEPRPDPS
jgi:hypothetical protein